MGGGAPSGWPGSSDQSQGSEGSGTDQSFTLQTVNVEDGNSPYASQEPWPRPSWSRSHWEGTQRPRHQKSGNNKRVGQENGLILVWFFNSVQISALLTATMRHYRRPEGPKTSRTGPESTRTPRTPRTPEQARFRRGWSILKRNWCKGRIEVLILAGWTASSVWKYPDKNNNNN